MGSAFGKFAKHVVNDACITEVSGIIEINCDNTVIKQVVRCHKDIHGFSLILL